MKQLIIFDNKGESFDRFTIIEKTTGEMIGASLDPFHPQGFGQHCGNVAYTYFIATVGSEYMRRMERDDPKHYKRIMAQKTKDIIKEFKSEGHLGKVIPFESLPAPVQKFARQSFEQTTN